MWLLDTHTLRLHHFESPEAVEEGYAILSHVWGVQELSFQELQEITGWCERSGGNPHAFVTTKISRFCQLAELHGYKWAWIDTCCIDKTSSAEISETLNAMFRYYSVAQVCYVHLAETSTADCRQLKKNLYDPENWNREVFSVDTWHRRGWTLQELIAPRTVHFLSEEWEFLGSKRDLAVGLERITGIPAGVLKFELQLEDISIAQRMSWASRRWTTRPEDEAYCLMGIFNVNMPTLYGEGRKAFRRLQEEVLKRNPDTTLFAWGGFYLGWVEGDVQLLLILRKTAVVSPSIAAIPLYTIGFLGDREDPPLRMVKKPLEKDGQVSLSYRKATWMDVYLSHSVEPPPRKMDIYLPVNYAFPPLIRISEHTLVKFFHWKIVSPSGWRWRSKSGLAQPAFRTWGIHV
ncbi:heterokaryon incompatibility protein-domain-containing protein [Earliella scabrosa]|nr:heterokaryon incompatibility protein-domain-containing protein [Earliella scabrosa]